MRENLTQNENEYRMINALVACCSSKSEIVCKFSSDELIDVLYKKNGFVLISKYLDTMDEMGVTIVEGLLKRTSSKALQNNLISAIALADNIYAQKYVVQKLLNKKSSDKIEIATSILLAISKKPHLKRILNRIKMQKILSEADIDISSFKQFNWYDNDLDNFQILYSYILYIFKKTISSTLFLHYMQSTSFRNFFRSFDSLSKEIIISMFLYLIDDLDKGRLCWKSSRLDPSNMSVTLNELYKEDFNIIKMRSKHIQGYEYILVLINFNSTIRNLTKYKLKRLRKFWVNAQKDKNNVDLIIRIEKIGRYVRTFNIVSFVILSLLYFDSFNYYINGLMTKISEGVMWVFRIPQTSAIKLVNTITTHFIKYTDKTAQNILETVSLWFDVVFIVLLSIFIFHSIRGIKNIIINLFSKKLHHPVFFLFLLSISSLIVSSNISYGSGAVLFILMIILYITTSGKRFSFKLAKVNPISQIIFRRKRI